MSKPAGNFTCADLLQVKAKIDEVWADAPANRIQFIANTDSLQELKARQTSTVKELEDPKKKKSVKVYWLSDCEADEPIEEDNRCVAGGNEVSSDCEEYALEEFTKRGLTIEETRFEESLYDYVTVLAFGMMRRMKQADEAIQEGVLTKLATLVGTNQYTGGVGDVSGATTYIPPTAWTANIMGYFAKVMKMNRYPSGFLLSGDNLFDQAWMIGMQASDSLKGASDVKKMNSIPLINDLFGMESVLPGETYLISPGAYSFVSRAINPSVPREITNGADIILYSQPSKNIPGLVYDITYKTRCADDKIYHDFGLTSHWDFLGAPKDCNTAYTFILKFLCGAAA